MERFETGYMDILQKAIRIYYLYNASLKTLQVEHIVHRYPYLHAGTWPTQSSSINGGAEIIPFH